MIITQLPYIFYEMEYEAGRINTGLLIIDTLSYYEKYNKLPIYKRKKMVYELELNIYNKIIDIFSTNFIYDKKNKIFNIKYKNLSYELIFNLSHKIKPKNNDLVEKILNEELSMKEYVNTDFKKTNELLNKKYEQLKMNRMNVQIIEKFSKLFECPRCNKREVTYENRYNRSFDEAVNKTFNCNFCQYSWNG